MFWLRRLGYWFQRRREEAALAEELEHHRALVQADLEAGGLSPAEAAAKSRRAMGNITLSQEDARDVWISLWMGRLWRDGRYALRSLKNEPTFTLTAALTLALGVAVTTTTFSIADAELWKPLPYPHPEQLVVITTRGPAAGISNDILSGADLVDWRAGAAALADIAAVGRTSRQVLKRETADSILVTEVTPNYFETIGRRAIAGRVFSREDGRGTAVAVLTDRGLRRLFAGDPAIVGRTVTIDARPVTIAGVVEFDDALGFGSQSDAYLAMDESARAFLERGAPVAFSALGRLRSGATMEEARAEVQALLSQRGDHRVTVQRARDYYTGYNWRPLYFFLGASLLVLLLSAVNVATLFVSRALRRAPEFALRGALGGGQGALARQLLVEGALLALPAGAVGVVAAMWAIRGFVAALPADFLMRGRDIPLDLRAVAFALGVTGLAALVFALVPLPIARRLATTGALRIGQRSGPPASDSRSRNVLLAAQVAMTVVLLSGAAIFLKSFIGLTHVPLGFDPEGLFAVHVTLSGPNYASDAALRAYVDRLNDAGRAVPGVRDVTVATSSPLGSGPLAFFARAGRPRPAAGDGTRAIVRAVDPNYFRTVAIPIVRGRAFAAADVDGAPRVAVINATMARQMFGANDDPVGQVIDLLPGSRTAWITPAAGVQIVGVAANAKEIAPGESTMSDVYLPLAQMPSPRLELVVRASPAPAGVLTALRDRAGRIDPSVPATGVETFTQRVDDALRGDRFNTLLIAGFAGAALVLAAIGMYGAAAYRVQARRREFAVRLALGAQPREIVTTALARTARLVAIGGVLGIAATLLLARVLGTELYSVPGSHDGILFGVTTTDPAMLAIGLAGVLFITMAAAGIPARQATRVDPAQVLRAE